MKVMERKMLTADSAFQGEGSVAQQGDPSHIAPGAEE